MFFFGEIANQALLGRAAKPALMTKSFANLRKETLFDSQAEEGLEIVSKPTGTASLRIFQ
jgi:membrane-bound lytic murein transglycosylase B